MHGGGSSDEVDINLTPLLDVVLQLIMFFLITVNFERQDRNDKINLPPVQLAIPIDAKSKDRPEHDSDNWVFLNLNKEGILLIPSVGTEEYEKVINDTRLQSKLEEFLRQERKKMERVAKANKKDPEKVHPVVVLRADKDARFEHVYNILELCSNAGFKSWQLRVIQSQKAG